MSWGYSRTSETCNWYNFLYYLKFPTADYLSMQGIGTVAIDRPRFEEFLRSRKDFFEVSQRGPVRGSRKDIAVGLDSRVNLSFKASLEKQLAGSGSSYRCSMSLSGEAHWWLQWLIGDSGAALRSRWPSRRALHCELRWGEGDQHGEFQFEERLQSLAGPRRAHVGTRRPMRSSEPCGWS